ncbi:MAG TPA: 4-alpha-glucanotransferase [Anaerolineae bacterium]|nr:4-alpha-glucanotransferase [Anaerolineae bacterium]HIQ06696.1 4-alpha-glucanotransferase [Anaerolineae bacterium]
METNFPRSSGILLHPTSLPSRFGIGDLGEEAHRFVDFLASSHQQLWQVLPLGPTGYGDSPYQCFSAFAGNPLLISLERMVKDGYLPPEALEDVPALPDDRVDYGAVINFKIPLLKRSFAYFQSHASPAQQAEFQRFCQDNDAWLSDFALFMALKDHHGGAPWNQWEPDIATRQPEAITRWAETLAEQIQVHKYLQFLFFQQWLDLKQYTNERGIRIIGDIPIFVAYDSADVWSHPDQFYLNEHGNPTVVAGVPPDYFSPTGQLWGNPIYRWDVMTKDGFAWWIARFRATLTMVDIVRLDHFRGFEAYWEVPATEKTAIIGRWVKGPGAALFQAVRDALGRLPIIAEDLGVITPEVEALRDQFGFPGMKVLQFAFDSDATNPYLPHNYPHNCVVYTGTHDNDTTLGWFRSRPPKEREAVLKYLGRDSSDICWDIIRLAWASVAAMAIVPLQDVLELGSEARMNMPSSASGNWIWRYIAGALTEDIRRRLDELTLIYGRWGLPWGMSNQQREPIFIDCTSES